MQVTPLLRCSNYTGVTDTPLGCTLDQWGVTATPSDKWGVTETPSDKWGVTETPSDKWGVTETPSGVLCKRSSEIWGVT